MAEELRTFRPLSLRVTFEIDGRAVETTLYGFQDIPCKDAEAFFELDRELQQARAEGRFDYAAMNALLRKQVRLICPQLEPEQIDALRPRQMQEAVTASYEVGRPPLEAGGAGAASPSPSAASTTPSPTASTGGPSMSRT
jgi:hypothetical protein